MYHKGNGRKNKMAKIIFLKGLPASGKSTWAKAELEKGNFLRVNKDDIRSGMLGGYSKRKEKDVIRIRNELICLGIKLGKNIIVDDTNLNPTHERTVRGIAKELNVGFEVNDSFLEVSPDECVKRDLNRPNSVGESVIWQMYEQYIKKNPITVLDENFEKRRCVIFDVDGTLAHNLSGRSFYDLTKVDKDTPDPFLSVIADALDETEAYYLDIVIVSGREETCRAETEAWLAKNMIPYQALYMRKAGDNRDDVIVKEEIYHEHIENNYAVLGVFDDRPKVCRMWRSLGFNVAQMGNPRIEF